MDEKVIAAIIAAVTSIITIIITSIFKPRIEKRLHRSRIEIDHELEQKKKIKEVLSKYKIHLISSADSLRGRLNNFAKNYTKKEHYVNGNYVDKENYYFQSMIYRILNFYAWMKVIDNNLIYLDTTIASEKDLNFIKYMRAMKRSLQRGKLVHGLQVDPETSNDLIYRDTLDEMCLWLIDNDSVIPYPEFKARIEGNIDHYKRLCEFIDGVNPDENRRRWDRLYLLQLLIMSFINSYGYDFQFSSAAIFDKQIERAKKYDIFPNAIMMLERYKLEKEENVKRLIEKMNEYGS
ncbi:MAG: hypothetical protein R3D00_04980 [Bacteroidia bacterium]